MFKRLLDGRSIAPYFQNIDIEGDEKKKFLNNVKKDLNLMCLNYLISAGEKLFRDLDKEDIREYIEMMMPIYEEQYL